MKSAVRRRGIALAALVFAGCAPAVRNMQVDDYVAYRAHPDTVGLHVEGDMKLLAISNEQFSKAVEASLVSSRVFSSLVELDRAVYRLDVVLGDERLPVGFKATTVMTVLWSLSRVDTEETVWQRLIASSYTASFKYLVGVWRARISIEGAARENIRQALSLLSDADLQAPEPSPEAGAESAPDQSSGGPSSRLAVPH